jgi:sugar phosphate isomerase/epimerase
MVRISHRIDLGGTARNPDDVITLHELGLQFAEIPIHRPSTFSTQIGAYQELKKRLGLYYLCHGPREGDPNDTEGLEKEYLPKVAGIFPLMAPLGMSLLTIHLWLDPHFVKEKTLQYKVGLLKRIVAMASEANITVGLENLSETPADMDFALREIPSLQLTLDLGHAQLLTEANRSEDFIDRFPGRIEHVHVHDNRGGRSHLDDLHLPPPQGIIDFERIFRRLREIPYAGTMTLELKPEEIRRCLPYVKGLLAGEKQGDGTAHP